MTSYILSPRARGDLDDIWEHTSKYWSAGQVETYLRMIQAAIDAIATDPRLGRSYDEVRAGYRRQKAGSHLIIYRETVDAIDIVRVLHEKRTLPRTCRIGTRLALALCP